jgi:hypothetical protein
MPRFPLHISMYGEQCGGKGALTSFGRRSPSLIRNRFPLVSPSPDGPVLLPWEDRCQRFTG